MAAASSQNSVNLRSLSCELGLLNKTDGSALFSHGMYIVIVNHDTAMTYCKPLLFSVNKKNKIFKLIIY